MRHGTLHVILLALLIGLIAAPVEAQQEIDPTCIERFDAQLPYERAFASRISWSPDGHYLAVIYTQVDPYGDAFQQGLAVYDGDTFEILTDFDRDLMAYASPFANIVWSPTSERLVVANGTGQVLIVEAKGWRHQALQDIDSEFLEQLMWSEDGRELALVSYEPDQRSDLGIRQANRVHVWDADSNSLETVREDLLQARVSRFHGQWYIALRETSSDSVSVYRLGDETPLREVENAYLVDLAPMTDHLRLASVEFDPRSPARSTLRVWDVESGQIIFHMIGEEALAYSTLIADMPLLIARPASGTTRSVIHHLDDHTSVMIENQTFISPSPNGQFVAGVESIPGGSTALSATGDILITHAITGEIMATITQDQDSTLGLAWSPDSMTLAATSTSGTITTYSFVACQ